ncbi:MltR family transcriptional regulator [Burkholderia gladioli]|uniref:MltR family transcriptional regulator n=1 Tax=Burkholderia gladioli TaxID=28095 RepID=UPI001ABAFE43|nr:MltR family transcriptional regulator [Burkholderia gladioli]
MATSQRDEDPAAKDDAFGPLNRLTRTLRDHDERGLILSLAAFAEEALGRLIEAFMLPVQAGKDLLTGFNAPLGTLSSRIKASYALGLINEEQFKDLEHLRKIRNEFAHAWEHVSLDNDKLASLAKNMSFSYLDDYFPETNADKVRSSITAVLMDISSLAQQIHKNGTHAKVQGTRLIPMFSSSNSGMVQQARELLERVRIQITGATGERERFCNRRLELLTLQLEILISQVPKEMRPDVATMLIEAKEMRKIFS